MAKTVTVFGATGTSGGGAARKLAAAGWTVRGITRDTAGDKARAAAEQGITLFAADLDDRASIRKAIEGADAVYFAGPSLLNRWDIGQAVQGINAVDAAIEVGMPHFVYQSALTGDARGYLSVGSKRAIEERIAETELPVTILQPAWFMDNFLNYFPINEQDGKLVIAMAIPVDKVNGLISAEDIGNAAAAVITNPHTYIGRTIDLTADIGSPADMARIIGEEVGKDAVAVEVPLEAIAQHWPEGYDLYKWLSTRPTQDDPGSLTALIGKPLDFRHWVRLKLAPGLREKFGVAA
ncbi:NmrA family NAD(P)-binding protein [Sphingomonas profundi]|uniref:NmrA family NAD(P)-binding protein n=1 Tax=Alterirhizorhabdus profundi TaxID=2681549 RepID=UPI0018CFFAD1|nr:NmrA family NAD(P)-binding protein [Sphingomonas profundi]